MIGFWAELDGSDEVKLQEDELKEAKWYTPEEIPPEAYSLDRIGITAGASTPDEIINAVEQALQKGYSCTEIRQ